jgi:hypothetical protein
MLALGRPPRLMHLRPQSSIPDFGSTSFPAWRGGGGVSGLWPQPQLVHSGNQEADLSPLGFELVTESTSTVLNAAVRRYWDHLLFPFPNHQAIEQRFTLRILVSDDNDTLLALGVDESYHLIVPQAPASGSSSPWEGALKAKTVFGALRGLETFSQLIRWNEASESYSLRDLPLRIVDWPRFPWRYAVSPPSSARDAPHSGGSQRHHD